MFYLIQSLKSIKFQIIEIVSIDGKRFSRSKVKLALQFLSTVSIRWKMCNEKFTVIMPMNLLFIFSVHSCIIAPFEIVFSQFEFDFVFVIHSVAQSFIHLAFGLLLTDFFFFHSLNPIVVKNFCPVALLFIYNTFCPRILWPTKSKHIKPIPQTTKTTEKKEAASLINRWTKTKLNFRHWMMV